MELYGRIKPWECLNQGWAKKGKTKSPNIIAMIERFNCTSQWVVRARARVRVCVCVFGCGR